jgi:hypothetical protein
MSQSQLPLRICQKDNKNCAGKIRAQSLTDCHTIGSKNGEALQRVERVTFTLYATIIAEKSSEVKFKTDDPAILAARSGVQSSALGLHRSSAITATRWALDIIGNNRFLTGLTRLTRLFD